MNENEFWHYDADLKVIKNQKTGLVLSVPPSTVESTDKKSKMKDKKIPIEAVTATGVITQQFKYRGS
jgi:hypothetical protein